MSKKKSHIGRRRDGKDRRQGTKNKHQAAKRDATHVAAVAQIADDLLEQLSSPAPAHQPPEEATPTYVPSKGDLNAYINARGFQENSYSARSGEPIAYVRAALSVLRHIARVGNGLRNGWVGLPHSHSISEYAGCGVHIDGNVSESESDSDSVSTQEGE